MIITVINAIILSLISPYLVRPDQEIKLPSSHAIGQTIAATVPERAVWNALLLGKRIDFMRDEHMFLQRVHSRVGPGTGEASEAFAFSAMYVQVAEIVALRGERQAADGALERFQAQVIVLVTLQGGDAREAFPTKRALVPIAAQRRRLRAGGRVEVMRRQDGPPMRREQVVQRQGESRRRGRRGNRLTEGRRVRGRQKRSWRRHLQ